MTKEPLYPHVPKGRQPLFPHVPKGQQPAERLGPELLPVARLLEKWSKTKARNSALALKDLEALGTEYDIEECRQALLDYKDITREDYSDAEEYQEEKDTAWEQFLESLESLAGEEEAEEEQKSLGRLPQVTIEGGELIPPKYQYLRGWISEPLPREAE